MAIGLKDLTTEDTEVTEDFIVTIQNQAFLCVPCILCGELLFKQLYKLTHWIPACAGMTAGIKDLTTEDTEVTEDFIATIQN